MSDTDRPWSNLGFAEEAAVYVSASQNARVLTEGWIAANAFCPSCGAEALRPFPNNSPVADFGCPNCAEEYELKAKRGRLGPKVVNGAYRAMTARLQARNNPSLLVMAYDKGRAFRPSIPATTTSVPRSGSSCRCCATGAGWRSVGAGRIGAPLN